MENWRYGWKKVIAYMLAAVLAAGGLASFPAQAEENADAIEAVSAETSTSEEGISTKEPAAADETTGDEKVLEEEKVFILDGLPDKDELLAAYMDRLFDVGTDTGISAYGSAGQVKLTDANEKKLYQELRDSVEKIAGGVRTSSIIRVNGLSISQQTWNASVKKVISYLLMDCPYDLYWFDKKSIPVSVSGYGTTVQSVTFSMTVAKEYRGSSAYTADPSKISAAKNAVSSAKAIVAKHAAESDQEKLRSYCQEICALVSYNTGVLSGNVDYGNPWQLIWVFDGNPSTNVVCEGYAKAFQYLCDLSGFNGNVVCYSVTGTMSDGTNSGDHMWNIVSLNGTNYLVDVTNSDSGSIGSDGSLFLAVPKSGTIDSSYTFLNSRNRSIIYTYSSETKTLLGRDVLGLTDSDRTAVKQTVKVTKIKITAKTKTMNLKSKKTQTLKVTVSPAKASNRKAKWKSSNKKIATVNAQGKVTAKKAGTVKITAVAKDGSGKRATIKIKIKKK